jgi:hypothetical protein
MTFLVNTKESKLIVKCKSDTILTSDHFCLIILHDEFKRDFLGAVGDVFRRSQSGFWPNLF